MIIVIVFSIVVGRIIVVNSVVKLSGKLMINKVDDKNIIFDKMVLIVVSIVVVFVFWFFLNKRNRMKNRNVDMGLLMMLGICLVGNVVVSVEMILVIILMMSMFCICGNRRMFMNIMISIIFGFMLFKKGGIME